MRDEIVLGTKNEERRMQVGSGRRGGRSGEWSQEMKAFAPGDLRLGERVGGEAEASEIVKWDEMRWSGQQRKMQHKSESARYRSTVIIIRMRMRRIGKCEVRRTVCL